MIFVGFIMIICGIYGDSYGIYGESQFKKMTPAVPGKNGGVMNPW